MLRIMATKKSQYLFFGKTLFFPDLGILTIGDLHLGFEYMLRQSGVFAPEIQVKEIKEELTLIFSQIKEKGFKIKKIVFIGDIKHSFSYSKQEKNYFKEIYLFLQDFINKEKIILIKGNHDTIDYSFGDLLKDYFIEKEIVFIHGHKMIEEAFDKKVKTVVMGHLHPSVLISDTMGIKKEKYKCFLIGKFKSKEVIILPSFLNIIEGTNVNESQEEYEDYFSIIPKKSLMNFKIYPIGEEIYSFGKVKDLYKVDHKKNTI